MQRQITPIVITLSLLLGVALWRVPLVQGWTPTGDLNVGRYRHTATLLPDGRVLVHGGSDGTSALYSTELYDPATGRWTFTGGGFYGRVSHTATLLLNSRVLVAGGRTNTTNSEEFYDLPTGQWIFTTPLLVRRTNHAATLLPNGRVLVAGGHDPSAFALHRNSAEAYNPVALEWTPTAPLHVARSFPTMTVLPNGHVLVAGGAVGFDTIDLQPLRSAEVYDSALTCSAITVYPPSAPPATQGAAYTALFGQRGSSGITVWSLSAGTLPNGLALNTANGRGVLAGVPTAAGTFHFTVRATNGNCVGERAYTLVVTGMSATAIPSPLP